MDLERDNHQQIERLNQRGGRTLSIVDLLRAGTVNLDMAAHAMRAMEQGASLLTGARPGGAGKTTLMAALLNLLPPGVRIVTVDNPAVLTHARKDPSPEPRCYLVHEIGSGSWYGYLWGPEVADFLALARPPQRIASCLHADTLEELTEILTSPPLRVPKATIGQVGLILFMHVSRGPQGLRRRVVTYYEADGQGGHRLVFRWDPRCDRFEQVAALHDPQGLKRYRDLLQSLVEADLRETQAVRRRVLEL